jgi:single-stranded-DNA-specific exonuclease
VSKVAKLNELGIDVIITDHHEPKEMLPEAVAILDPKLDDYPCKDLSGCGVALKLAQALYKELGLNSSKLIKYFDLVALATVADIVPLTDENRIITKFGLQKLERTSNAGLQSLLEITGLINRKLNTYHLGFILGPRVNAQGRLGGARDVVLLFTTGDREEAHEIAKRLDDENRKRMEIQGEIVEDAYNKVKNLNLEEIKGIVLAAEEWHPGVIGIAASRIVERFYRPVILIALDGDTGKGSARSIPEFHLYNALKECDHILESFGGHKLAAGLIIERKNIEKLKTKFNEIANNKLRELELVSKVFVDQELSLTKIDKALLNSLDAFNPLGLGNPKPVFLAKNVQVVGYPKILNNKHLKFKVRENNKVMSAIAWHSEELFNSIATGTRVDLVYGLRENEYLGHKEIELNVVDVDVVG